MAKTRLRNDDREAIRNAVLAHKFDHQEIDHNADEAKLAEEVRQRAYGKFLATVDAAPAGAFPENSTIIVNVAGKRIRLHFGHEPYPNNVRRRVFDKHAHGDIILAVTEDDALGARIAAWAQRGEEIKAERRHLASIVDGTLARFYSFDDLQKGWHEADRFIVERWQKRGDYHAPVPAVAIRDLSTALDLPPEGVAPAPRAKAA